MSGQKSTSDCVKNVTKINKNAHTIQDMITKKYLYKILIITFDIIKQYHKKEGCFHKYEHNCKRDIDFFFFFFLQMFNKQKIYFLKH